MPVANAYINKRECGIQEYFYHILPGQWLRKTFPVVIFAKSNTGGYRDFGFGGAEVRSKLVLDSLKRPR